MIVGSRFATENMKSRRRPADKQKLLFHRPAALTLPMSVNIVFGERGSPTLTTSRMSVYFADTDITYMIIAVTGVCEINTHPTSGTARVRSSRAPGVAAAAV